MISIDMDVSIAKGFIRVTVSMEQCVHYYAKLQESDDKNFLKAYHFDSFWKIVGAQNPIIKNFLVYLVVMIPDFILTLYRRRLQRLNFRMLIHIHIVMRKEMPTAENIGNAVIK